MSTPKKYARRAHSKMYDDADFKHKLSAEEREWYEKFLGEIYDGFFTKNPIHDKEQKAEIKHADYIRFLEHKFRMQGKLITYEEDVEPSSSES